MTTITVTTGYHVDGLTELGIDGTSPNLPISTVAGSITLNLLALNKVANIGAQGIISSTYNPSFTTWNAVATCDISLASFRNMFVIQTDGIDVDDISGNDIRFYVNPTAIPSVISFNTATVTNGAVSLVGSTLESNDQIIGKDYIRHLADLLFNTPHGVDLFTNEAELVASVNDALNAMWTACKTDLEFISLTGTHDKLVGNPTHKYLLHNTPEEDTAGTSRYNICREMFRILTNNAPGRFATDLSSNTLTVEQATALDPSVTPNSLYYLPLRVGDQIAMRMVLKPSPSQDSFQNATKDDEVRNDMRAYIIVLKLT
jgi:hypothetical protein